MSEKRVWQVDAFRGLAVVLMIVFHFFFDLDYLGLAAFSMYDGAFLVLQRVTAFLFLSLVGVSLVLAKPDLTQAVRRFLLLSGVAFGITLATLVYPGKGAIFFGIIHLIALSVLLGHFFLRFNSLNLFFGSLFLLSGFVVSGVTTSSPLTLWLGLRPAGFYTLDYYPLIPWFGLVLFGIFLGKKVFQPLVRSDPPKIAAPLGWLGRHALWIYLVHQPVIFGVLWVCKYLSVL